MIGLIIKTRVIPAFKNLLSVEALQRGQLPGEVKMEFYLNDEGLVRSKLVDKAGTLVREVTETEFTEMFK